MALPCFLLLSCCYPQGSEIDQWIWSVRWTLRFDASSSVSQELRQALLLEVDHDVFEVPNHDDDLDDDRAGAGMVHGIPRRPLYKELAYRLFCLGHHPATMTYDTWLLPAEQFGFQEDLDMVNSALSLPTPTNLKDIPFWLNQVGDLGILRLLGLRQTIGTDPRPLVPASRTALLDAANRPHHPNGKLTTAARARSKHAHRGTEGYFGTIKGSPESQNDTTHQILVDMLDQAVWINIHTFSGRTDDDDPVLELRVKEGYGARWTADWSSLSSTGRGKISFRGFLEPQMDDGHEKKWRH